MKIKMLKDARGSADGTKTTDFNEGEVYDLGPEPRALELAKVFVKEMKVAVEVKGVDDKEEREPKPAPTGVPGPGVPGHK